MNESWEEKEQQIDKFVERGHFILLKSYILQLLAKAREEGQGYANTFAEIAREEGRQEGIKQEMTNPDTMWEQSIRQEERTRILKLIEEMEWTGHLEEGSEFASPRDYRHAGWNQALEALKEKIEGE